MKFQDYEYKRIDMNESRSRIQKLIEHLKDAKDYQSFYQAYKESEEILEHLSTMEQLSYIRHSINTKDEFYNQENDFWDENSPFVQEFHVNVVKAIFESPYREELKKDVPETFFLIGENALRSFDERIIEDLQEENRLISEYDKLIAKAQIEFDGKTQTLASLMAYFENPKEKVRCDAFGAYWGYLEEQESKLDAIYDKLVKLRDKIAKKLGFDTFVELGYIRMDRFGYHEKEVSTYRQQILKDVVPVATKLYEAQRERLGLEELEAHNENYIFNDGNPMPKHDKNTMVEIAGSMYREMSKETGEFIDFMIERDLLDLEATPGKMAGGYCTYVSDYKSPFIFANFNGTSADVDVLTHEAGHAFQVYCSRGIKPSLCIFPSSDGAEIHSMGMEFFAWPWMKQFFEEDTAKYFYYHLAGTIKFLPYGALVDHFQHEVYRKPNMSIDERKDTWRRLEKMYLPHKNYDGVPFLEKGTWWLRQSHIFGDPFYYIDYTLAQVVALQFWKRLQEKDNQAFADYHRICKIGGSRIFTDIVEAANLKSPFEEGCLTDVMKLADEYLEGGVL
jgi:M3 family oligoendopeptidase